MKNRTRFGGAGRPRRSSAPIVLGAILVILVAFLALLWSRGGERPMTRVEKAIPADRLGK